MTAQVQSDERPFEEQPSSRLDEPDTGLAASSGRTSRAFSQFLESTSPAGKPPRIEVLLIHGLNGNPSDLAEVASVLQTHAMATTTMRLPGHGEQGCEMRPVSWQEWVTAVQTEVQRLKERSDLVFLLGHSLGAALALYVAAQEAVTGVVALSCPLLPWLQPMVSLLSPLLPVLPTLHADLCDPVARLREGGALYRWAPTPTIKSGLHFLWQVQAALPQVRAPALIMVGLHDHVVPAADACVIYHLLGSSTKQLVIFPRSAHVLLKDYDRQAVLTRTVAFILRQAQQARAPSPGGENGQIVFRSSKAA
jgi:carboxylesterase